MDKTQARPPSLSCDSRAYGINEVVRLTGVPAHTLRRWEQHLPGILVPPRTKGGIRRYSDACLATIQALDWCVNQRGMSLTAAGRHIEASRSAVNRADDLAYWLLNDKRIRQAIEELVSRIRRRVIEIVRES